MAEPIRSGPNHSLIGAMDQHGLRAAMVTQGAIDAEAFRVFVEHFLCPTLQPGDVVVMDNLSVHKDPIAQQLITDRLASTHFLPAYSPDLNPIEECWSKIKALVRGWRPRTIDALYSDIARAINKVTATDCRAWINHAGYRF
jgi:transposase